MLDIFSAVFFFPLAFYLPGYMVVTWFTNQRASRGDLKGIEALFLCTVLSVCLTGIVALALAQAGYFSLPALIVLLALGTLGLAGLNWLGHKSLVWAVASSPKTDRLIVVGIVAAAGFLFFRPHQFIYGAVDAGVYVNLGANLDGTGALLIREPLVADIGPDLLPGLLREQPADSATRFIRLPGFYLSDSVPGKIIPQFFPLHPVWLGMGYSLYGTTGALLVTPIWGVLSLVAIFLLCRFLFDVRTGILAAVILLLTPLQIYFSRYPTAEPLTQFLSWTFLWAFAMFSSGRSPRGLWGLAAGATFGLVFLTRIDALPMLLVPAAWALSLLWRRRWDRSEWWFWIPLALLTGYALFHGLVFSKPYTVGTYGWLVPSLRRALPYLTLLGLLIAGLGYFADRRRGRWNSQALRGLRGKAVLRYSGVVVLVGLAVYAYVIRPRSGEIVLAAYWYADSQIPLSNHENLLRLGWYLSPLGIGLAVAGAALFLFYERLGNLWPLITVGGTFTVVYIYNIFNNPFQIYAMRRYVPIVVPFFVVAGAYAISWLWRRSDRRKTGRGASVLLLIALLVWLGYNDRLIWDQVDYAGATTQMEELANLFEEEAIVLFVDDRPVGLGAILGTPLQFLYGITSFDLQEDRLDMGLLEQQIDHWLDAGRPVYIARNPDTPALDYDGCLVPAGAAELDTPRLEQTYDHAPSMIQRVVYKVEVFRVEPACQPGG